MNRIKRAEITVARTVRIPSDKLIASNVSIVVYLAPTSKVWHAVRRCQHRLVLHSGLLRHACENLQGDEVSPPSLEAQEYSKLGPIDIQGCTRGGSGVEMPNGKALRADRGAV